MKLFFLREGLEFTLYSLEVGTRTVRSFLSKLEKDDKGEFARMMRRLVHLSDQGVSRKKDEFNSLGNDLYEAKTKRGSRIIFFYDKEKIVICTTGFHKKTAKTPLDVIKTAQNRKKAYEDHVANNKSFQILITDSQKAPRRKP